MVNKVSFLSFRGGDRPNRPPPESAPDLGANSLFYAEFISHVTAAFIVV